MTETINLANEIKRQLPTELVDFLQLAGDVAARFDQKLFLVGGVVRDLLLERANLDLDLVAEGDAIKLAEELASLKKGKIIAHSRFNTAKIRWGKWSVDIAAARGETYDKPGALPSVQPSDIQSDLIRRDFTINSMAVCLDPRRLGELIDLHGGQTDLEQKLIRVLHDNSFKDDATRMWRAVRYEQRLGFSIEPHTLDLLKTDLSYLDTLSGDRVRHELELCLEEDKPERPLLRASMLGILKRIHPALKAESWASRKIARARNVLQPYSPPESLYLAFLFYHLSPQELEQVLAYLNFSHLIAQDLRDTLQLKGCLEILVEPQTLPSGIYRCLSRYSRNAIMANMMAARSLTVREHIELYLEKLHAVHSMLTGEDLIELGVASGPHIREILEALREARLDGRVTTREDELKIARKMK